MAAVGLQLRTTAWHPLAYRAVHGRQFVSSLHKVAEMAAPEEDSFATVLTLHPSYLTRTNGTTIKTVDSFNH